MLYQPDAEIAKRDPALKGLSILLNPESFLESIRPFLKDVQIETVKGTYVKYKPSTHCLVLYELGVDREKVYAYAVSFHHSSRSKFIRNYEKLSVAGPIDLGRLILEEHSIVVNFFPNDRRLKVLPHFVDPVKRKQFFRTHFPESSEPWECNIKTLNYKPEQRYVGKLCNKNGFSAILKIYEKSGYQLAYRNAKAFKSEIPLVIPKPLRHSRHHQFVIYEWITGKQLSDLIGEPKLKLGTLSNVGSALSVFHNQTSKKLAILTRAAEVNSLMATADFISLLSPKLSKKAKNLAQRISSHILDSKPVNSPIHGDFYSKQILIDGNNVTILDNDWAALGNPAADLGNFISHLERDFLNGNLSSNRVEALSDALIEAYEDTSKKSLSPLIILYTAVGLLRLALDPFRYREPNWPEKIEAILDRAAKIMKELPAPTIIQNNYDFQIIKNINAPSIHVTDPFGVTKDPYMQYLYLALNPIEFQKEFDTNIQSQRFFKRKINLRSIHVNRYKPGKRCLIEYTFEEERDNGRNKLIVLIGKVKASGLRESGYKLLKSLRKNGFGSENKDEIFVPKPVGIIQRFNMWLQNKVSGKVSTQLLTENNGTLIARKIADAAHKIHLSGIPTKRRHTMVDELTILRERLSHFSYENPKFEKRIERLLKECERVGDSVSVPQTRGIHRDFYPDQIVIDGTRLYVLDFDLYCNGDPALDIGNFLGHITEQSLRALGNPDALLEVEQAMEDRFVELSGEATRPRVQAYKILTLARHIHISTVFPERRPFTERILELCEERLSTLDHNYTGKPVYKVLQGKPI
jgi:thiamine kinase-like enzyme